MAAVDFSRAGGLTIFSRREEMEEIHIIPHLCVYCKLRLLWLYRKDTSEPETKILNIWQLSDLVCLIMRAQHSPLVLNLNTPHGPPRADPAGQDVSLLMLARSQSHAWQLIAHYRDRTASSQPAWYQWPHELKTNALLFRKPSNGSTPPQSLVGNAACARLLSGSSCLDVQEFLQGAFRNHMDLHQRRCVR